jgi:hypothetical protein
VESFRQFGAAHSKHLTSIFFVGLMGQCLVILGNFRLLVNKFQSLNFALRLFSNWSPIRPISLTFIESVTRIRQTK